MEIHPDNVSNDIIQMTGCAKLLVVTHLPRRACQTLLAKKIASFRTRSESHQRLDDPVYSLAVESHLAIWGIGNGEELG
jgi:hypothetical protein